MLWTIKKTPPRLKEKLLAKLGVQERFKGKAVFGPKNPIDLKKMNSRPQKTRKVLLNQEINSKGLLGILKSSSLTLKKECLLNHLAALKMRKESSF